MIANTREQVGSSGAWVARLNFSANFLNSSTGLKINNQSHSSCWAWSILPPVCHRLESWLYCTIHLSLFHSALSQYKELAGFPFKSSSKSLGARGSRTMSEATTETSHQALINPLLHPPAPFAHNCCEPTYLFLPSLPFPSTPPNPNEYSTGNHHKCHFCSISNPRSAPDSTRPSAASVSLLRSTKGLQWATRVPPGSASWQPSSRTELLEPVPRSQRVNGRNFSGLATSRTPRGPNPTLGGLV